MPAEKCFILCPTKATKPKGKPRAKAPQTRTNARGRGGKPSSTAASTTAVEVAVPPAEANVLPDEVNPTSGVDDLRVPNTPIVSIQQCLVVCCC